MEDGGLRTGAQQRRGRTENGGDPARPRGQPDAGAVSQVLRKPGGQEMSLGLRTAHQTGQSVQFKSRLCC